MAGQLALAMDQRPMSHTNTEDRSGVSRQTSNAHLKPAIGSSRCKCGGCQQAFNSLAAFDMHQRLDNGRVVCMHPLDVVNAKGRHTPMVMNAAGWWVTALREEGTYE